ncbi:hypothetical protein [Nocardia terpenica]|uniref:Uncharacterized protein n=1 Tax=Nocardia terpenica TaxID=455432 RepID=A0A6G9ZE04_9NOCA|nr:hypothetical protein [Nocardia terpenica]QIS23631.1 hypothetical protein F6W96_40555 [Nocardia terpenica]
MTGLWLVVAAVAAVVVNGTVVLVAPRPGEHPRWAAPVSWRSVMVRLGLLAAVAITLPIRLSTLYRADHHTSEHRSARGRAAQQPVAATVVRLRALDSTVEDR